jgi:hypothetical protein
MTRYFSCALSYFYGCGFYMKPDRVKSRRTLVRMVLPWLRLAFARCSLQRSLCLFIPQSNSCTLRVRDQIGSPEYCWRRQPLEPVLSQSNSVHISPRYWRSILILPVNMRHIWGVPSFPRSSLNLLIISVVCITYPHCQILLYLSLSNIGWTLSLHFKLINDE